MIECFVTEFEDKFTVLAIVGIEIIYIGQHHHVLSILVRKFRGAIACEPQSIVFIADCLSV